MRNPGSRPCGMRGEKTLRNISQVAGVEVLKRLTQNRPRQVKVDQHDIVVVAAG